MRLDASAASGAAFPSLDGSETKSDPLAVQSRAQRRIHRACWDRREAVIQALASSEVGSEQRRAERMAMCCVAPLVCVARGKRPVCVPGRCRDRLCPTCNVYRSQSLRAKLEAKLRAADQIRMLTLTLPRSDRGLGATVDWLHECFRALRATGEWKRHVRGGAAIVEVTRGSKGEHWHVHMHVLVEGEFWPQREAQAAWSRVVGELAIVDIRAVHSRVRAATYLAKYVAKGVECEAAGRDVILELARGLHRRRLIATFGKWHATRVDADDDAGGREPLPEHRVSFAQVRDALERGVVDRDDLLPLLVRLSRTWRLLLRDDLDGVRWLDAPPTAADLDELTQLMVLIATRGECDDPPRPPKREQPESGGHRLWGPEWAV